MLIKMKINSGIINDPSRVITLLILLAFLEHF